MRKKYARASTDPKKVSNQIKQNILIIPGQARIRWLAEKKALSNGVLAFFYQWRKSGLVSRTQFIS